MIDKRKLNPGEFAFMADVDDGHVLKSEAERRRDAGIEIAANRKSDRIAAGKLAFLNALLSSPTEKATIDDATVDLKAAFEDGGKWRGAIPRDLAFDKIIERVAFVESNRPSRHCGPIALWRLIDRPAAVAMRSRIKRYLELKNPPVAADGQKADSTKSTEGELR